MANNPNAAATKTLPPGTATTPGLTIIGNGQTLTLNDGAGHHSGFYSTTSLNVSLSNITLTGSGNGNPVFYANGDLTINTSGTTIFTGNASLSGGAMFARQGSVIFNGDAIFTGNNTTSGFGGAVYADIDIRFTDPTKLVTVSGNHAIQGGGGLNAAFNISVAGNLILNGNTAGTSNGGGVRSVSGNVNLSTTAGNATVTANTAGNNGGGIFTGAGSVTVGNPSGTVTIGGSAANGNRATANGGGIFSSATTTINGNTVDISYNRTTNGNGGGINSVMTTTITGSTINLSNNTAGNNGGGIYAGQGATVNGDLTASNNAAVAGNGGAIEALNGNILINGNLTANSNTANRLGGAFAALNGNAFIAQSSGNASLTNNTSSLGGGAIYANGGGAGNVTLGNSAATITLTGNKGGYNAGGTPLNTTSNGGAVYAQTGSATLTGSDITVSNNAATLNGGAIYSGTTASLAGKNITLSGNTAGGRAGAINSGQGTTITGTPDTSGNNGSLTISNNTAAGASGGAVYAGTNLTINGPYSGILIDHNTAAATSGDGGAFYAGSQGMSFNASVSQDLKITNNASGNNGGALYTLGDINVTGDSKSVLINANSAANNGGAIYAAKAVNMTPASGTVAVTGNRATNGNGGAIYAATDFQLTTAGAASFTSNSSGGKGGAVWAGGNVALNAAGGDIAFSGNMHDAPIANAIWLNNTAGAATATFNAGTGRTITFFDPIQNNAANGLVNVIKSGNGLLSFDGSQYSSNADRWSQIYGSTQVQAGTFEVANNAVYGMQASEAGQSAASSFGMGDNTVLQGGAMGTVKADAVSFGNGVTLNIAGRQPATRGVFVIDSPSLALGSGDRVLFNTYLNNGVVQNTDLLRLSQASVSGTANLFVTNVGGPGMLTVGNGIMLVNAINGASTASNTFQLNGRVVAGIYEYDLYQGGVGAAASDGNWYLRSIILPTPTPPGPAPHPAPKPAPRPEPYLYVRNLAAASTMFIHTLHDRLGEPQYTEAYRDPAKAPADDRASAGWVRVVSSHADSQSAGGRIGLGTDTSLIHFGGDLARWNDEGDNRYHLGVMGAYGKADTDAAAKDVRFTNNGTRRKASGDVEGYSVGIYGTWFGNGKSPERPYVDAWAMYGWYDNTVKGNGLPKESYDSKGWTVSVEGGYALIARENETRQWMIEPQIQLAYTNFKAESHREANGTQVDDSDANGFIGRIGARVYSRSKQGDNGIQPFIEGNIWYSDAKNSLDFNGQKVSDGVPNTRYELKLGAQGEIRRNWQLWGHLGNQWGKDDYGRYEAMIGTKYMF